MSCSEHIHVAVPPPQTATAEVSSIPNRDLCPPDSRPHRNVDCVRLWCGPGPGACHGAPWALGGQLAGAGCLLLPWVLDSDPVDQAIDREPSPPLSYLPRLEFRGLKMPFLGEQDSCKFFSDQYMCVWHTYSSHSDCPHTKN